MVLDLDGNILNIINIYAPQTDSDRRIFFSSLDGFISEKFDNIIGGDYNCISNAKLDKFGGNPNARHFAATTLHGICTRHNLSDIWRDRHKDKRCFTWTAQHPTNGTIIRTRIDKFLISNSLNQSVLDASIKPFSHSDHDSVWLTLNFDQVKRGPGYWHFNNDLLCKRLLSPKSTISGLFGKPSTRILMIRYYGGIGQNKVLRTLQSDVRKY
jgi:hypothetical protein